MIQAITQRLAGSLRAHVQRVTKHDADRLPAALTLPPRIVCRLLEHLALRDRLALAQTCTSLRAAALTFPHLWSQLRVDPLLERWWPVESFAEAINNDPPKVWQCVIDLLGRSAPVSARVVVSVDVRKSYSELAHLVTTLIQRSSDLTLDLCAGGCGTQEMRDTYPWPFRGYLGFQGNVTRPTWARVSGPLSTSSPALRSLSLSAYDVRLSGARHPHPLFLRPDVLGGDAPQLQTCILRGITLPIASCAAFLNLTLFDYQPWPALLDASGVDSILRQMPQLQILGLNLSAFSDDRPPACRRSSHPNLRQVSIVFVQVPSPDVALSAAAYFESPNLHNLSLDFAGFWWDTPWFDIWDVLRSLLGHPAETKVYGRFATSFVGKFQVTQSVSNSLSGSDNLARYSHLSSLTLCEYHLPNEESLPPAPMLEHLHIILLPQENPWPFVEATTMFLLEWSTPWDCPVLRHLQLSYLRGPDPDCALRHRNCLCNTMRASIALMDVVAFITANLRFSNEHLDEISLCGFSAVVDPEPDVALIALQRLAKRVEVREEAAESAEMLRGFATRRTTQPYAPTNVFKPAETCPEDWDVIPTPQRPLE